MPCFCCAGRRPLAKDRPLPPLRLACFCRRQRLGCAAINGERFAGDPFQDFALSPKILYGTGQDVVVKYAYFSLRTGKGEQGEAALIVSADASGAANKPRGFSAQLNAIGKPAEYTYSDSVGG